MKTLMTLLLIAWLPQSLPPLTVTDGYFENVNYRIVRFDTDECSVEMFWKNTDGEILGDIDRISRQVNAKGKELVFACNGGMFMEDLAPLGLYIENGVTIRGLNVSKGHKTNFYIQPNGVFHINTDGTAHITVTDSFSPAGVKYATQSGGMLLVDGVINPKYDKKSESYRIRNGVGVDKEGKVYFILSKCGVNFYDFASVFHGLGCTDALFLDGDISCFYLPSEGFIMQNYYVGVMIGVVK